MGNVCCSPGTPPEKRRVQMIALGVDGAGKTHAVKRLRGESPADVDPTIGFSSILIPYDRELDVCIYDIGGREGIRPIWGEYLAECHGLLYVVDVSAESRYEETFGLLKELAVREDVKDKPILIVLNRIADLRNFDDISFVATMGLHDAPFDFHQKFYIVHMHNYNGYLEKAKPPYSLFVQRQKKANDPLLDGFKTMTEKVLEHFVELDVGVTEAKRKLAVKLAEDKKRRELLLAQGDMPNGHLPETEEKEVDTSVSIQPPPENFSSDVFESPGQSLQSDPVLDQPESPTSARNRVSPPASAGGRVESPRESSGDRMSPLKSRREDSASAIISPPIRPECPTAMSSVPRRDSSNVPMRRMSRESVGTITITRKSIDKRSTDRAHYDGETVLLDSSPHASRRDEVVLVTAQSAIRLPRLQRIQRGLAAKQRQQAHLSQGAINPAFVSDS